MNSPAVEVRHVSKKFRLYHERNQSIKSAIMRKKVAKYEDFWALRDITFSVPEGSTFGLIGSNGSGKSTLLKCLARILTPDDGEITAHGRIASLLEVGSGFHPELSGRENIFLNGSILGMKKREIEGKLERIVDFSGIGEFIDQPVKNYSSGMYVRLGFAIAIHVEPDVLVVDEILAVGDAEFQQKCEQKFIDLKNAGKTVILVSHSLPTIEKMCDQAAWIEKGSLKLVGPAEEVIQAYSFGAIPIHPVAQGYFDEHPNANLTIGWPVTSERHVGANGGGWVQGFKSAALVWREGGRAIALHGPIREFYDVRGGLEGRLGWPVSQVVVTETGECRQEFENGTIVVNSEGVPAVEL